MPDKFIDVENGKKKLKSPLITSSGPSDAGRIPATNSEGKIDSTLLPSELGAESFTATAGENLSAWDLVYLYDDAGTLKVKKAIATSESTLAKGYVKTSVNQGQNVTVYTDGYVTTTGLNPANNDVYLSNTQAGKGTTTAPTTGWLQVVGRVVGPTQFSFEMGDIIQL